MKKFIVTLLIVTVVSMTACAAPPPDRGDNAFAPDSTASGQYDGTTSAYPDEMPAPAPAYDYTGEKYLKIVEGATKFTNEEAAATVSLKVDTAAYTNVKRYLENSELPPADAVRTEEMINYFKYDEQLTFNDDSPFAVYTEVGPSPFDDLQKLAFVRVKTKEIDKGELPPSNLVFLIDTSGSMDSYDKLPLLQNAFSLLVETLGAKDTVSIVTYAGSAGVVAQGVSGADKNRLNAAIYDLEAGGSTAGAEGVQTAYELAKDYYIEGGNNRVILASDGDFNVGISDPNQLGDFIASKRDDGMYLSILGFGTGNVRDDIMETLSKEGNGNYSYIDSLNTAQKVLVNELGANLFTVADDVKAQVVFNPDAVRSYRLIGYENRTMANEDFEDDTKDAGELGAGSDVVLLFEMDVTDPDGDLFEVSIRYKDPGKSKSKLLTVTADERSIPAENTTDFGFASSVALFGDLLRHPENVSLDGIVTLADLTDENIGDDPDGYRSEYRSLLYQLAATDEYAANEQLDF